MQKLFFPDDKDSAASTHTHEDPPTDLTEQNKKDSDKSGSEKIDVPKEAVDSYKESGKSGEE